MGAKLERVEWAYQIIEEKGHVLDDYVREQNTFTRSETEAKAIAKIQNAGGRFKVIVVRRKVITTDWEEVTDAE